MHFNERVIKILLILGLFLLLCAERAHSSDDWQYWNEFVIKHKLTQRITAHVKLEQRIVNDFGNFALHNYAPGFVYEFSKYFDFELNYKFERVKIKKGWIDEHRLEIIPIFSWQGAKFKFKLRSRLEYRVIEGNERWRWREKIKIKRDINLNGFKFSPFLSEEIFYDLKIGEFNQNRVKAGVSKEIIHNLEFTLFYMYKSNKLFNSWFGANVLGTEFVIRF
jgi:hypothetical protein